MISIKKCLKSLINVICAPKGIKRFGKNTSIRFPRKIKGNKGIAIGHNTFIDGNSWVEAFFEYKDQKFSPSIEIGNDVQIGRYATITAISKISIGNNCLLSEYIYISDHFHDVFKSSEIPLVNMPIFHKGDVQIGNNCFIGFRAIILPGVTLGDHCIVGAASVVTKSFPPNSVIGGVPAKLIKTLSC